MLSRKDEKSEVLKPIHFFPSSLSDSQRNYAAGQLEGWALVVAMRKWRVYLKAAPKVILITAHNPLRWLRRQRDSRHTFARRLMGVEEIPYEIRYRLVSQMPCLIISA